MPTGRNPPPSPLPVAPSAAQAPARATSTEPAVAAADVSAAVDKLAAFDLQTRTTASRTIRRAASEVAVPILTTNFEEVLSEAARAQFLGAGLAGFTDYYPWQCRFAHALLDNPCDGFGIWHINGMARYKRSIRLGLADYIGSAQRARMMLHRGGSQLFRAKDPARWEGARTWLHLVFNKPLLFLGLALEENEVFLRWLLIERARYFRKFPERAQPAWFVFTHNPRDAREAGKHFFLEGVGLTCVRAADHDEIWTNPAWSR